MERASLGARRGDEETRRLSLGRVFPDYAANGVVILKYHDRISPRPTKNMPRRIELNLREPTFISPPGSSPLWFSPRGALCPRPRETIPQNSKSCKDYGGGRRGEGNSGWRKTIHAWPTRILETFKFLYANK